jgi:hypothetical protein
MGKCLTEVMGIEDVQVYTDTTTPIQVTRDGIIEVLWRLCVKSYANNLECVWIFYSGHGSQEKDIGGDEKDGQDEAISPSDRKEHGKITDDLLSSILSQFNPATQVICVFDSCHSGTMADLPYESTVDGRNINISKDIVCASNIICLSACLDNQVASERVGGGILSTAVMSSLYAFSGAKKPLLVTEIFKDVQSRVKQTGFSQQTMLTSSRKMDTAIRLRQPTRGSFHEPPI